MNPIDYLTAAIDYADDTIKRALGARLIPEPMFWTKTTISFKSFPSSNVRTYDRGDRRYTIREKNSGFYTLLVEPGPFHDSDYLDDQGCYTIEDMAGVFETATEAAWAADLYERKHPQ